MVRVSAIWGSGREALGWLGPLCSHASGAKVLYPKMVDWKGQLRGRDKAEPWDLHGGEERGAYELP